MKRDVGNGTAFLILVITLLFSPTVALADGRWDSPPPQGYMLSGLTWNGTRYVALGNGGTILYSNDGAIWRPAATGTEMWLHAVDWNGRQFIAVGKAGTILTSPDGITWTLRNSGASDVYLHAIAHSADGAINVAVGSGGTVVTSADGIHWTRQSAGVDEWLNGIAWNGAEFVAVGSHGIIIASVNGTNWAQRVSPVRTQNTDGTVTGSSFEGIAWGSNRWLAVPSSKPLNFVTSLDGINWTTTPNPAGNQSFYAITYDSAQQQFVAVGAGGRVIRGTVTSSGSLAWTQTTTGWPELLRSVTTGQTGYVVAGEHGLILESNASASGWQRRTTAPWPLVTMNDAATDGTGYVAVGNGYIVANPDAANGSPVQTVQVGQNKVPTVRAVVYTPDGYVAVTPNGSLLKSTDGTEWALDASVANSNLNLTDIALAADGALYAVSTNGSVVRSSGGGSWQTVATAPAPLYAITSDGPGLLAVGDGVVIVSNDLTSWEPAVTLPGVVLRGVAAGNGIRVAVGSRGTFFTYANGAWTQGNVGTAYSLNDVTWNGSRFIAVGDAGTIFSSSDGIHWDSLSIIVGNQFLGVAASPQGFVTVGEGSTVIYHDGSGVVARPSSGGGGGGGGSAAWLIPALLIAGARGMRRKTEAE